MSRHRRAVAARIVVGLHASVALGCTADTFEISLTTDDSGSAADGPTTVGEGPADSGPADSGPTDSADSVGSATDSVDTAGDTGCAPEQSPWWNPDWRQRRRVRVDVSGLGDGLVDFPVLVRIPAEALGATWSERQGADLRVRTGDDRAPLHYDIDDLAPDGRLPLWIRVPEIHPEDGELELSLYYDNPAAPPGATPADVWSSYLSVHHLGPSLEDSANDHHGTTMWAPPVCDGRCGPKIGQSRHFEPLMLHEVVLEDSQDYDFSVDPYDASYTYTVSLWLRSSSLAEWLWGAMVVKGDNTWRVHSTAPDGLVGMAFNCYSEPCSAVVNPIGNVDIAVGPEHNVSDGIWHHYVVSFGFAEPPPPQLPPSWEPETRVRLYLDGELVVEAPMPFVLVPQDLNPVRFGNNVNNQSRYRGDLDEVRINYEERTPEWIAAEFAVVDQELATVLEAEDACP